MGCEGSKESVVSPTTSPYSGPRRPPPTPRPYSGPRRPSPPPRPVEKVIDILSESGSEAYASDFYEIVKIEIENVKDELMDKIPPIPEEYSPPLPTTLVSKPLKSTTEWFSENIQTGGPLSFKDIDIDEHARKARQIDAYSMKSLIRYLTSPVTHKKKSERELLTVRAIVVWMSNQDIGDPSHRGQREFTPRWFLWMLNEKRTRYSTFFSALCREANLECVLLDGPVKAGDYEAGDLDPDEYYCTWNAVKIDDQWQIVHPFWICRVLVGHQIGGWVKIEADGESYNTAMKASKGVVQNAFEDYYFLVDPEEFIFCCYPECIEWQLLPEEKQVRTKDDFMRLPYFYPPFFALGLKLISKPYSCVLNSVQGVCRIEFLGTSSETANVTLQYVLFVKYVHSESSLQQEDFPRYVFQSRNGDTIYFEIRFPEKGTYKLVLYGGRHGGRQLRCCEFRINCEEPLSPFRLLPSVDGNQEWGPGPDATKAGLLNPTVTNGIISIQPKLKRRPSVEDEEQIASEMEKSEDDQGSDEGEVANIKFDLDRDKMNESEYKAEMTGSDYVDDYDTEDLQKHIKKEVDRENATLVILATIPAEGEFALTISVSRKEGTARYIPACHYLLTSFDDEEKRIARENLRNSLSSDNIDEIEDAIILAQSANIPEKDRDIRAAKDRIILLKHRKESLEKLLKVLPSTDSEEINAAIEGCFAYGIEDDDLVIREAYQRITDLQDEEQMKWRARQELLNAISQESSTRLERAMKKCRDVGIGDDDDDMARAEIRLQQQKHLEVVRTHLLEMINTGDIEDIEAAINRCLEAEIDGNDKDIVSAREVLQTKKRRREAKEILRKVLASCEDMKILEAIDALEQALHQCRDADVDADDNDVIVANGRLDTLRIMKEAKHRLRETTEREIIDDIKQAIEQCLEIGLSEKDDDVSKARSRIYFLERKRDAKKKLQEALEENIIENIELAIEECLNVGFGEDDEDVIMAKERLHFLREKHKVRQKMLNAVKEYYVSDLEKSINIFREYCTEEEDEVELARAEETLVKRQEWDQGLLKLIKPLRENPDSIRVKLMSTDERTRETAISHLLDKAKSTQSRETALAIRTMIEQSDKRLRRMTSEKKQSW